jgi:hypothetical protein
MANNSGVQNVNMFKTQSPYDQQIEEMKRRQQMAEMLQQQALQPLESQVAPGGMVVPTSPILGLTKMLQAYMGGKQLRDIEKQRGEREQLEGNKAMNFLKDIRMGQQQPMSADDALGASLSATPTEAQRMPMSAMDKQGAIDAAMLGGSPQMRIAAQLAAMKPEEPDYYDAVPVTVDGVTKMIQYPKSGGKPRETIGQKYEKPTSAPESELARLIRERAALVAANPNDPTIKQYDSKIAKETQNAPDPNVATRGFSNANTLRDEYTTLTQPFRQVQDAYTKIKGTGDTGAGDMSLLYSYVKMLDPGSAVKEGEFETAASSGSFGQRVQNAVQRVRTGGRLEPELRRSFLTEAEGLYKSQLAGANRIKNQYQDLAKRYSLNPQDVIVDYTDPTALESTPQRPVVAPYQDPMIEAQYQAYRRNRGGVGVLR